jgi:hypothetical protein
MKKKNIPLKRFFLLGAFLLLSVSYVSSENKGTLFKPTLLPNKTYRITERMKMDMSLDYPDEGVRQKFLARGVQLPLKGEQEQLSVNSLTTKTGKGKSGIPLTAELLSFKLINRMQGKEEAADHPANKVVKKKFSGIFTPTGQFVLDQSRTGPMDQDSQALFSWAYVDLQKRVRFPNRPLAIGDEFTEEVPGQYPGMPPTMTTSRYTLLKIEQQKAQFRIIQTIRKDERDSSTDKVTGTGKGTMDYDLKNSLMTKYDVTIEMNFEIIRAGLEQKALAIGRSTDITEVRENR